MARCVILAFLVGSIGSLVAAADQDMPKVLDERLQLDLMAESPQLMTPTGVAIEKSGRVLVIESHTHFPPKDYDGPKHDRILAFDPKNPRSPTVFYEGSTHTMNLAVHPDGSVYVATRQRVFRLRDSDGDGRADQEVEIAHLETKGNYPHNGLSGFAFGFEGDVYFGFGENLGADYKLIGSDGTTLSGGGEGGNVYHCRADGSKLRRMATGFWNPFAMYLDPLDRLFVVDNDPDSRPPCRLLHVVEQGDYGYRFRNGRKGVHPFTAWNGELPGTLPMVAGTGEAPSGIVGADSDQWPDDLRGTLIVTSWGDHRIECYPLKPRGISFTAERKVLVSGGDNFRPAGMAIAPDGSIWFSDWVDKSYELHKKGRLWRLSAKGKCGPEIGERTKKLWAGDAKGLRTAIASSDRIYREAALRVVESDAALQNTIWPSLIETVRNSLDTNCRVAATRTCFRSNWFRADDDLDVGPMETMGLNASAPSVACTQWRLLTDAYKLRRGDVPSDRVEHWLQFEFNFLGKTVLTFSENKTFPGKVPLAPLLAVDYSRFPEDELDDFSPLRLVELGLEKNDPFVFHLCIEQLRTQLKNGAESISKLPKGKLAYAIAAVRESKDRGVPDVSVWLSDPDMDVRFVALNYVHDHRLVKLDDAIRNTLKSATNRQVFEAALTTLQVLSDKPYDPSKESRGEEEVAKLAIDPTNAPELRTLALRMLRADHPALKVPALEEMLGATNQVLATEAARKLGERTEPEALARIRRLVEDKGTPSVLRAEAVAAIASDDDAGKSLLIEVAKDSRPDHTRLAESAIRQLRGKLDAAQADQIAGAHGDETKPRDLEAIAFLSNPKASTDRPKPEELEKWLATLQGVASQKGDPERGRAVFFSRQARCSSCHESEGRGAAIGPNLTGIGKTMTRARLLGSILRPSAEVAPQFAPFSVTTHDGISRTGLYVGEEVDGTVNYIDDKGKKFQVHPRDLENRQEVKTSIMPEQLVEGLTLIELKDLLAYLGDGNDVE